MTSRLPLRVSALTELPIEVAEAMYSPDFVELSSLSPGGTPLSLPMSFTLDLPGNCLRFSSPVAAGRLRNYARDPRCSVLCSRVTAGQPPVLIQGTVTLGEVVPGMARGPARQFTVTPVRITVLGDPPVRWHLSDDQTLNSPASGPPAAVAESPPDFEAVDSADLQSLSRLPSTVVTLRDVAGWPLALPAEFHVDGRYLAALLPSVEELDGRPGRAAVLGHTWSKAGPRYLAATGRAALTGKRLTFHPARVLRRGL